METWTLNKRTETTADLPAGLINLEDWPYQEHHDYAYKQVMTECQGGLPNTIRFVIPIAQNTVYLNDKNEDEYTHWINVLTNLRPEQKIISIAIGDDGQHIALIKMTAAEHLQREPSVAQIAELYKLYHHHLT